MGLNPYFTFGVVGAMGVEWQVALAAVFVEGLLLLVLAVTGIHGALLRAIPAPVDVPAGSAAGTLPRSAVAGDPSKPSRER